MGLIRFRATRLWAVAAAIELLMGTVLYTLGHNSSTVIPRQLQEMLPQLSVSLVAGGTVLLLMARVPIPSWMKRLLVLMSIIPPGMLLVHLKQDPLTPVALAVMAVLTLISPWLPTSRGERGKQATIWADLSVVTLGITTLFMSGPLFTAELGPTYGVIQHIPWLIGLMSLGSAVILLMPLTGHTLLEPWSAPWRLVGGITPATLSLAALSTQTWSSAVLWSVWALVMFRGLPIRGISTATPSHLDLEQKQEDQIHYMERLLEIWMWVLAIMVMSVSVLGNDFDRLPITLFICGIGLYNAVMHLICPDLGTPEQRIFWHLGFLTIAVGALMLDSHPLNKNFLAVLVITPFVAARLLGANKGAQMLLAALTMSIASDLGNWLMHQGGQSPFSGAAAFGMMSIKLAVLAMAGWMGVHSASEQRKLVDELAEAREDQSKQIQQLEKLANYDALTGLFNRRRFRQELEKQLEQTVKRGSSGALCFLDLDGFKYINDSLGHQAGDDLLIAVGDLLRQNVRERDIVARLGGDEFAVILPGATRNSAEQVATRVLDASREHTVICSGHQVRITASIGIVLFPEHGEQAEELLSHADVAMYQVKENGRNGVHTFVPDNSQIGGAKLAWEKRIREALEYDRFVLYAQPIVDLATGRTAVYELLLRMLGDNNEIIPPGAFLPIAERFGLIHGIDRWVVRHAIHLVAEYRRSNRNISVSVNISGKSMADPELLALIKRELMTTRISPDSLIFEITETSAIADLDRAGQFIGTLRAMGCRFAVDDFGNGYSSFRYIKNLDVDFVKIDGNFIQNMTADEKDQIFVKAMVQMARGFKMATVAEFVENEQTVELLRKFGVNYGQGYFLGRPVPVVEALGKPHR